MEYLYEKQRSNYEDFASGRVLLNASGTTAFPVRLASELFLRGIAHLRSEGNRGTFSDRQTFSLYDPLCGGGHLLTTIGLLNGKYLHRIVGSDIDGGVLEIAGANLSMVNLEGLEKRQEQLKNMYKEYGKDSHKMAIESAERLRAIILERGTSIDTACFQVDVTNPQGIPWTREPFDLVITDLPYGDIVEWKSVDSDPVSRLLDHLLAVVSPHSVVIIVSDKKQSVSHPAYKRLQRFRAGKRQVFILQPVKE